MQPDHRHKVIRLGALVALGAVLFASEAIAQSGTVIETGLQYHTLTGDYENWRGIYARGIVRHSPRNLWEGEAVFQQQFGDRSFLYTVANTRTLSERYYTRLAVGTSSGGFYNPRFRFDALVGRRTTPSRRVITTFGAGFYDAKDEHRDFYGAFELIYYARPTIVVQGGARFTYSSPGDARSTYFSFAATAGRPGKTVVAGRLRFGNEAYQVIEPLIIFNDFRSYEASLTVRRWIRPGFGLNLSATHYHNPFYNRSGGQLGVFHNL